ncbi:hypothetical protein NEOLI_001721 [Neolecta irregularis DAH-3]|uniref:Uncharacterized protein n=1 Tax=Neolecta irregularis (strain DAH-3) TaxID=1198029 RepID=A0A1U7LJT5_NEOID|nr:hypothetical protein NEOLI_001721 [Neolecta irregularis DAH-3]|eukprot:OLL22853.1 hypothetical protein NEOLI_001721 [Neolecta irregularis DAH-3]
MDSLTYYLHLTNIKVLQNPLPMSFTSQHTGPPQYSFLSRKGTKRKAETDHDDYRQKRRMSGNDDQMNFRIQSSQSQVFLEFAFCT